MRVLMTLVLMLVLAGCAAGRGNGGSTIAEAETTSHKAEQTTVHTGGGDPRRPPDSTLSHGRLEMTGSLGSYCWSYRGTMGCADTAGIPLPHNPPTLTVPAGSDIVFRYGGHKSPKRVEAGAFPLGKEGGWVLNERGRIIHHSLKAHGSGAERTIPAELPPGEYAVDVFVIEPQGDASYYFHVVVE
jgi:hypothetical protein